MNIVRQTAFKFIERAEALNYKGKKRDDAALDYFAGAATALTDIEHPQAERMRLVVALVISVRGYFGVKELAAAPDEETLSG